MLPHLIRNAIDHGLEATEDRPNAKSAEGILRLEFNRVSTGEIELTFQDDGVGIDIQNIAQIAIKRNIITTAQGLAMSSHDKLRLILEPRFSSRETISEFSGRGVGLSAVKSIIEDELGGSILITSKPGHGTTFLMHIPLTKKNKDRTQKKVA